MVNKCFFVGTIRGELYTRYHGKDNEKKSIGFVLAVRRPYKEYGKYLSDFIYCEVYIDAIQTYLEQLINKKNVLLAVVGRLNVISWQDKEKNWHTKHCINVENVQAGLTTASLDDIEDIEEAEEPTIEW